MKKKATIETRVETFLSRKLIAVMNVSDQRENGSNQNYQQFRADEYHDYAVNPHLSTYDGIACCYLKFIAQNTRYKINTPWSRTSFRGSLPVGRHAGQPPMNTLLNGNITWPWCRVDGCLVSSSGNAQGEQYNS